MSILQLVRYYPYFFSAVLLSRYNMTDRLFRNEVLYACSLILVIVILFCNSIGYHIPGRSFILPAALLCAMMRIMQMLEQSSFEGLKNVLDYIGTHTLDIYLFHYFVLIGFQLPFVERLLDINNSVAMSLIAILPFVVLIIALSLLIGKLIRSSKILNNLIFYR